MKTTSRITSLCVLLVLVLVTLPRPVAAQSFIGADAEIRKTAEEWRSRIAVFWTGEDFPVWSAPCRITAKATGSTGGGATSFSFHEGEVFGWDMSVEGTREAIIESALPHEVAHTILACITRRRLTRWVDEGLATLWEAKGTQVDHFEYAYHYRNSPGQVFRWFDAAEYPKDTSLVPVFYATSYTLIEWLLTKHDKETVLQFVKDTRKPSQKFSSHFGISPQQAEQQWLQWLVANYRNPPLYFHQSYIAFKVTSGLPTLNVATAKWCAPCRQFWFDLRTDPAFKAAVDARVNIVVQDSRLSAVWCQARNVQSFPSFYLNESMAFECYGGGIRKRKHAFIAQLDAAIKRNGSIQQPQIPQVKIDLGPPGQLTFPDESQNKIRDELAAAKERDTKLGSVLIGINKQLEELKKTPQPPVGTNAKSDSQTSGNAVAQQDANEQGQGRSTATEKIKQWAWFGGKKYLSLKYGSAFAAGTAVMTGLGWWIGKRSGKKELNRPVASEYPKPEYQPQGYASAELDEVLKKIASKLGGRAGQQQCQAPFPRQLDEASELRQLRESEGRVAALDTLVGMIFSDQVTETIEDSDSEEEKKYLRNLRDQIMDRVNQIAPIQTPSKGT